jgi:hypothetical protein
VIKVPQLHNRRFRGFHLKTAFKSPYYLDGAAAGPTGFKVTCHGESGVSCHLNLRSKGAVLSYLCSRL